MNRPILASPPPAFPLPPPPAHAAVLNACEDPSAGGAPTLVRAVNLTAVVVPFFGFVTTIVLLWGRGMSSTQLGIFAAMYVLTGFGITVGFHRLFTHRSFDAARPVKLALAVLGSMAVEGPLMRWVAHHRRHHQHSDRALDPHSPHLHGEGLRGVIHGLWHAHVGWLFEGDLPGLGRYVGDLRRDSDLRRISRLFPLWVALGLLIPAALGGILTRSWHGALMGFVWGGLARIFLVHHVTWSINSVCHLWGRRPSRATTKAVTTPCSACSPWARVGTTTTTRSPPAPDTASPGGNSTGAIG